MRIIIIGSGIAGLSTYLNLHKHLYRHHMHEYQIQIYETYDVRHLKYNAAGAQSLATPPAQEAIQSPKIVGGAIGIGKNGLSVLRRLDDDGSIAKQVQARGNAVSHWRMGTARGWKIIDAPVQGFEDHGGNAKKVQTVDTIMITRQACWEVLRDAVLAINPEAVATKKVTGVTYTSSGVQVTFSDNTTDTADLLIGADGLRSIVRRTIFANSSDTEPQSWTDFLLRRAPLRKDYITPQYEGLTGVGGFVPASVLESTSWDKGTMAITFGPNGFFGYGYVGPISPEAWRPSNANNETDTDNGDELSGGWWSTFSSELPKTYQLSSSSKSDELTAGETDVRATSTKFDKDTALRELLTRHRAWKNPTIQAILQYVEEENNIEHVYPTFTTPELPRWFDLASSHKSEGREHMNGAMVLVGDAAHALQPSSGQGACQALEDGEALALFLAHHLTSRTTASPTSTSTGTSPLDQALHDFESLRKPRVAAIYVQSQKMSRRKMDMGFVAEMFTYLFIWAAAHLRLMQKYNDTLFQYDLPREVEKMVKKRNSRSDER